MIQNFKRQEIKGKKKKNEPLVVDFVNGFYN